MKREKSCGALGVRKNGETYDLVLLRHRFGGHWSFPKGHVEEGESERQTALREVHEETGLSIRLYDGFRESVEYFPKPGVKKQVVYFLGEALDAAASEGFSQVLLVSHAGKLVKVAGGIMNTHSRWADCRTELICAHAAAAGAGTDLCRRLLEAPTADACLALLDGAGLRAAVLERLLAAIQLHLERRAAGAFQVGAVMFSNEYGLLGMTGPGAELLQTWRSV